MSCERISVGTDPASELVVGAGALEEVAGFVGDRRVAVLTDATVEKLHLRLLGPLADVPRLALAPGEAAKSIARVEGVLDFLAGAGLDRASLVVTFGGGVVSDLGGFAASLFLRGIDVVHCPTTLLAQCDAAIGGKTAVNLLAGKNLAGTFHHPRAVFLDPAPLATLPTHEFRSGLGEVLKTAVVGGEELLTKVETMAHAAAAGDSEALTDLVAACARVKAEIVAADPRESGERAKLNLGHTFAHGIERAAGFGRIPHGEAVGLGVLLAARAAHEVGIANGPQLEERLANSLERLGLCASLTALLERHDAKAAAADVLAAMTHDKKGRGGKPLFVLPRGVGDLVHGVELPAELVTKLLS
ncbi:MAG TPA: 3-dehydroquinate synthase [Planctomycetes bacterium]|nr:3-dehydroquinate synthase [Planctomycetota bacterium]